MTLREALDAHEILLMWRKCSCGWRNTDRMDYAETRKAWADHREQAVRAALAAEPPANETRCEELEAALRGICTQDLRPDFPDGGDIILRWPGNRADWERARAILAALHADEAER